MFWKAWKSPHSAFIVCWYYSSIFILYLYAIIYWVYFEGTVLTIQLLSALFKEVGSSWRFKRRSKMAAPATEATSQIWSSFHIKIKWHNNNFSRDIGLLHLCTLNKIKDASWTNHVVWDGLLRASCRLLKIAENFVNKERKFFALGSYTLSLCLWVKSINHRFSTEKCRKFTITSCVTVTSFSNTY